MRQNQAVIYAHPTFKHHTDPHGEKWGMITFPSPRAAHIFAKEYTRTINEISWIGKHLEKGYWCGLGPSQSIADFDSTGIARYPLECVQKATGALEHKTNRLSAPRSAITGGRWSVPAVLQNAPKAAIRRPRKRLAPVEIKIAFFVSAGITAESMAPTIAKIAKAIHEYTEAGGVVTLTMYHVGHAQRSEHHEEGFIVETKIPCADFAQLALALSPAYYRIICGPLQTAFSSSPKDVIYPPSESPVKDALFIGGSMGAVHIALAATLTALKLED